MKMQRSIESFQNVEPNIDSGFENSLRSNLVKKAAYTQNLRNERIAGKRQRIFAKIFHAKGFYLALAGVLIVFGIIALNPRQSYATVVKLINTGYTTFFERPDGGQAEIWDKGGLADEQIEAIIAENPSLFEGNEVVWFEAGGSWASISNISCDRIFLKENWTLDESETIKSLTADGSGTRYTTDQGGPDGTEVTFYNDGRKEVHDTFFDYTCKYNKINFLTEAKGKFVEN